MTTPADIIQLALKDSGVLGVGQTALAEDTNDAFTRLNYMLGSWQRERWLIWHLVDYHIISTGANSYTVGPTGDIAISPRPDRIESAFFRQIVQSQPYQVDYPLEIIESYETYSRIALKQLQNFPQYIFYDSDFPTATIYNYPVIQANLYELHIQVKETLAQFTTLTQAINLPLEYMSTIHYNLCARLRPAYQLPPDPSINALALTGLNNIRKANAQIPRLAMPTELVRNGLYNIYSDQTY